MTMISANHTTAARAPVTPRGSLISRLVHMHDVWGQRRRLKSLGAAALKDIGVTRAQAEAEAARAIWDAPQTWRR